jgi:hypothetical protein
MAQVRRFSALAFAVATAFLCVGLAAQAGDPAAIQQQLNAQFRLTTTTADRSDIVTAGDVVTIHKPGLVMFSGTLVPPTNNYRDGRITPGFATALITANPNTVQRTFMPEEQCWVTGIKVQRDGVIFSLLSDPFDNIRYYGDLKVVFPNKRVVPPVDSMMQTIAEVLTVVPQDNQGGLAAPEAQPAPITGQYFLKQTGAHLVLQPDGSFIFTAVNGVQSTGQYTVNEDTLALTYSATGRVAYFKIQGDTLVANSGMAWVRTGDVQGSDAEPAPASDTEAAPYSSPPPPPDIAPPPTPADTPPPTIALGQTKDTVIAAFGQPMRIAKLGVKEIFYYKDMKVTFTNGKVSNVE